MHALALLLTIAALAVGQGASAMAWSGSGTEENPYKITSTSDLDALATDVNSGKHYADTYFELTKDISYSYTYSWDSNNALASENNFTAIGGYGHSFQGHFDGKGHTISGIRIYKSGTTEADQLQGVFGYLSDGSVKNLVIADASITGYQQVGAIAGCNSGGTIEDCVVKSDVGIYRVADEAKYHGGIVGVNSCGNVRRCTSSATVKSHPKYGNTINAISGGIIGYQNQNYARTHEVTDNVALNAVVHSGMSSAGAIIGQRSDSYPSRLYLTTNHYLGCTVTVNGIPNAVNVGLGSPAGDIAGARSVHRLTLGQGITATGESVEISSVTYYASNTTVTLSYTGVPATGYVFNSFSATGATLSGSTLTMPTADVSVSATFTDVWGVTNTPAADGSENHPYMITTTAGLDLLAKNVNGTDGYTANDFSGKYFKLDRDIAYSYEGLGADESNFTAIGGRIDNSYKSFRGTFDGCGNTISGIRIRKGSEHYQGLFGLVSGGTIKRVTLTDADITGMQEVGGIAGYITRNAGTGGIIENCHVTSSVVIRAVADYAYYHGGIVGNVNRGTVSGCTSAATLTVADGLTNCTEYGGIVGALSGDLQNCLVVGASISGTDVVGAVAGSKDDISTCSANYYHSCTVNGTANATNVGVGGDEGNYTPHDRDGIRSIHTLTLGDNITVEGSETKVIDNVTYYAAGTTITLGYTGTVPDGYTMVYTVNSTVVEGNTFTMPATDVTVTAMVISSNGYCGKSGVNGGHNVVWNYNPVNGTLTISPNTTDPVGTDFDMADFDYSHRTEVPWYDQMAGITAVTIADGVTGIGGYNFYQCTALTTLSIGASVASIGKSAFRNSTALTAVTIPASVTSIGGVAFDGCTNLATVSGAENVIRVGGNAFGEAGQTGATAWINAQPDGIVYIGKVAYLYKGNASGQVVIADGTVAIADRAFSYQGMASVSLPHGLTYIGEEAFISCENLQTVTIPATVTYIDQGAFYYCPSLRTVHLLPATPPALGATQDIFTGNQGWSISDQHFYLHGTAYETGDWATLWNKMNANNWSNRRHVIGTITTDTDVTATGTITVSHNGTDYYTAGTTVTLGYTGTVPEGYTPIYTYNDGSDHAVTGNTLTMPAADVTVSATTEPDYATWWHADDNHDGSSEGKAYVITTTTGLNLLAGMVNSGTDYSGMFFKLGTDIAYTGDSENYTAIGTGSNPFNGTFNGDGHAISGIRINQGTVDYQGLFGHVGTGGTVKNVLLTDAVITGQSYTGAIVGKNNNGTLTANYYYNCSVNGATTNVGTGAGDCDGARAVNKLTLGEHISATPAAALTNQGNGYYTAGTTVTLSVEEGYNFGGYTVKDAANNDVILTGDDTFVMPATDVTVSADLTMIAMDGSGTEDDPYIIMYRSQMAQLAVNKIKNGKYYKLGRDLTYSYAGLGETESNYTSIHVNEGGHFDGDGHTISGIRIYSTHSSEGLFSGNYGTVKNVTLTDAVITGDKYVGGIAGSNDVNGIIENCHVTSTVIIKAVGEDACALGGIAGLNGTDNANIPVIRNCTSAATITNNENEDCTNFGGIVGLNTGGIVSGCTAYGASVTASRDAGGVVGNNDEDQASQLSVVENCRAIGCTINGNNAGAITSGYEILRHNYYHGCTVNGTANATNVGYKDGDVDDENNPYGAVHTAGIPLLDNSNNDFVITTFNGVANQDYTLAGRTLTKTGAWNTLCLPFDVTIANSPLAGATVKTLNASTSNLTAGTLTLTFDTESTTMTAGTPYIIKWDGTGNITNPTFTGVTIKSTTPSAVESTDGNVRFEGQYSPFDIDDSNINSILFVGSGSQIGYSQNPRTLRSLRAHFWVQPNDDGSPAARNFVLDFGEGSTGIREIEAYGANEPYEPYGANGAYGPNGANRPYKTAWYSLDGRKLSGKPTAKGLYIHGGRKTVIK